MIVVVDGNGMVVAVCRTQEEAVRARKRLVTETK